MKYEIDGQLVEIRPPDLDGDGVRGGLENISHYDETGAGIARPQYPSELKDTLREINEDELDPQTGMSSVDFKARIHPLQLSSLNCVDILSRANFLGRIGTDATRQIKRNSVSMNGLGRAEAIDAIGRRRDEEAKKQMGMMDQFKGFFGMGGKER